jgi:hypothetical protein
MSEDEDGKDPLLQAIGEFRQVLIRWIDTQLGLHRDHVTRSEAIPPSVGAAGTAGGSRPDPRVEGAVGSEGIVTTSTARASGRVAGPTREALERLVPGADPPGPRSSGKETIEPAPAADARSRLDALARQLGERVRAVDGSRKGTERAE